MVKINPCFVWLWFLSIILWCAHVIVIPEHNRIIVFNNGICIGLKVITPSGGHVIPISMVGDSLLWKNAQKNDVKNSTSDTINRIIPIFRPVTTFLVCFPWKVPSRIISRHH